MHGNFLKKVEHINKSNQKASYENICVIGLGTLGGFLAKNLSYLETTKSITLFDYDTVEPENLINSIYDQKDLGIQKIDAIKNKLNSNIDIDFRNEKFEEGKTKIPKFDLLIDCRDFTYDIKNIIDVRVYISVRTLIIDCRKNVKKEKHHEGKYLERLNKIDLQNATWNISLLIYNGGIQKLIDNQAILEIYLDYSSETVNNLINKIKNKNDLVYDFNPFEEKIKNLQYQYPIIIEENKKNPIIIYFGERSNPYFSKEIPINHFNNINDIISGLSSIIKNLPSIYNSYTITSNIENKKLYLGILAETGAA